MDNIIPIETRGRSRSKTPFLRSNCDNETCAHAGDDGHIHDRRKSPHVKKNPKIIAIIEENAGSSTKSTTIKQQHQHAESTGSQKIKSSAITTSDYSSNSSEDLSAEQTVGNRGAINTVRNEIISTSITTVHKTNNISKKNVNNNWIQKNEILPTPSTSRNNNNYLSPISQQKEISQNEMNTEFEISKSKTSTPIINDTNIRKNALYSGKNIDSSLAYKEYRDAGEYWTKFPKTDYTYSKLSPHRRELAPGIVGMPNMSRKSLEKHHERINYMIERSPEQETYIRARYEPQYTKTTTRERVNVNHLLYDSQDEVDLSQFDRIQSKTNSINSEIHSSHILYSEQTWITKIVAFFGKLYSRCTNLFSKENSGYLYETKTKANDGNLKAALVSAILSIFRYFYLLISSVLFLDTLMLRSSSADNVNKKRFLLMLLILLPLLLLAGAYYHIHPTEPFPPINFSEFKEKLPNVNLAQIKQFVDYENIDQIKANTLEKIDNLRVWSEDYFDYIKTVSTNVATETQKMLLENFSS